MDNQLAIGSTILCPQTLYLAYKWQSARSKCEPHKKEVHSPSNHCSLSNYLYSKTENVVSLFAYKVKVVDI